MNVTPSIDPCRNLFSALQAWHALYTMNISSKHHSLQQNVESHSRPMGSRITVVQHKVSAHSVKEKCNSRYNLQIKDIWSISGS